MDEEQTTVPTDEPVEILESAVLLPPEKIEPAPDPAVIEHVSIPEPVISEPIIEPKLDPALTVPSNEPLTRDPATAPPRSSSAELTTVEQSEGRSSTAGADSTPPEPIPVPIPFPELVTNLTSPITVEPFDVSSLSDADLKAAATLYTKRNQAEFGRRGVAKRKEIMELNLREITDYLSRNNGAPLPRIAKNTNITPGTMSKYLRQLIVSDKVRAEGWGKTRRYYLK